MATDIKLSKAQMSKIIQSGASLGKLLGPLLKTGLPLLKSVIKTLGLLGLVAASSAIEVGVQKKKKKKIVQALEHSGILLKGVTETIKNETKEQKGGFLKMFFCTLGASL